MTVIAPLNSECFTVNGIPKQRGQYELVVDWSAQLIGIRPVGQNAWIDGCMLRPVTDYNGGAYATIPDFINFLKTFLFL